MVVCHTPRVALAATEHLSVGIIPGITTDTPADVVSGNNDLPAIDVIITKVKFITFRYKVRG